MSQVQERLAVLDKKADIELDSVKSESGKEVDKSNGRWLSNEFCWIRYLKSSTKNLLWLTGTKYADMWFSISTGIQIQFNHLNICDQTDQTSN